MSLVSVGALCRLDDVLAERIRRGEDLGRTALSAVLTVLGGAAAYGASIGMWRAPEQALYSAVKLPLLFLAITITTTGAAAMLTIVLRARLSLRQTSICILLGFAVTSALLGALAPIALLVQAVVPPPDPAVVGLPIADPRVRPSLEVARGQVLLHVVVVAGAGMTGVVRLRGLLRRLGLTPRVLVVWMAVEFLVGAQLSWLLRPFFGRPHLPPSFSCDDLLVGNFLEEVEVSARGALGGAAGPVLWTIGLGAAMAVVGSLFVEPHKVVSLQVGEDGLQLGAGRVLDVRSIARVETTGASVRLTLVPDDSLVSDVLVVRCTDDAAAAALHTAIERVRARGGPFRT